MSADPLRLVEAAEGLVGTPFRLHGREPRRGIDCVGLVALAFERAGGPVLSPAGYALRNTDIAPLLSWVERAGLAAAQGIPTPGDILLLRAGPAQLHLAIAHAGGAIIHAHAGLGRVVKQPRPEHWPLAALWRLVGTREDRN